MSFDLFQQAALAAFSDNYLEARRKFVEAAPDSKAYPCTLVGPSGEPLFTDVAYFGRRDARKLLVLISGTHGVEGYCGSAAQLMFLKGEFHRRLPASTGVLFIHALNCWGFAWDRRDTAEGCDLNRNFVDFSEPLPQNPGYEELFEHLVPVDLSEEGIHRAEAAIATYRSMHTDVEFRTARGRGQYTRPGGAHYGGTGPTEARLTLERIVADFELAARDHVVIMDYHTGSGPYGYGEVGCASKLPEPGQQTDSGVYERALSIFGPSLMTADMGHTAGVPSYGTQAQFWQRALGSQQTYVFVEFGTYDWERFKRKEGRFAKIVFNLSRAADPDVDRQLRLVSKRYFYPQHLDWQEMVLTRSHQLHRQAMKALAAP
ncbi:DUF2817 domain-containing protein [Bradyrhizobium sp. CB1650]|uniref:DUF2817 domain-containing protein n=1 Tax=Bradyrhizobium sp. CB1650 TaxID=3039153 RepID=UPI0024348198|nr:DUF2817 domain-containing protein [Bradyrhizobium sp. CB1650]WGD51138.1 DUF2817 domain-containing protein [Bradyrhizobium sp. CB1650]